MNIADMSSSERKAIKDEGQRERKSMYKHTAEALVYATHTDCAIESLSARIGKYCGAIRHLETGRILDFGEGEAIIRSTEGALLFRVSARDILTFYGIQALLQGSLSVIATFPGEAVEWRPVDSAPFDSMRG